MFVERDLSNDVCTYIVGYSNVGDTPLKSCCTGNPIVPKCTLLQSDTPNTSIMTLCVGQFHIYLCIHLLYICCSSNIISHIVPMCVFLFSTQTLQSPVGWDSMFRQYRYDEGCVYSLLGSHVVMITTLSQCVFLHVDSPDTSSATTCTWPLQSGQLSTGNQCHHLCHLIHSKWISYVASAKSNNVWALH